MTPDQAFAEGFRWAIRNLPQIALTIVAAWAIMDALGYWWELIEAAQ